MTSHFEDDFDDDDDDDDAPTLRIGNFLKAVAQRLVAGESLAQVQRWAAAEGVDLMEWPETPVLHSAAEQRAERQKMASLLAWQFARFMPLPQLKFKPMALTSPGRNDPCICGSGKKLKQCCASMATSMPQFTSETLAPYLFLAMPRDSWASLPGKVPAKWVMNAMMAWLRLDDGLADALKQASDDELNTALALLAPWAELKAPWPAKHAALYDLLGDIYLALDMPDEREALAHRLVERGDRLLKALGWERRALMFFDMGQVDDAFECLRQTQQLDPDNPRTAVLELTLLNFNGEHQQAQERAAWHAKRLSRLPSTPELDHVVTLLQRVAKEGVEVLYERS